MLQLIVTSISRHQITAKTVPCCSLEWNHSIIGKTSASYGTNPSWRNETFYAGLNTLTFDLKTTFPSNNATWILKSFCRRTQRGSWKCESESNCSSQRWNRRRSSNYHRLRKVYIHTRAQTFSIFKILYSTCRSWEVKHRQPLVITFSKHDVDYHTGQLFGCSMGSLPLH
jgi:hypothetical protein